MKAVVMIGICLLVVSPSLAQDDAVFVREVDAAGQTHLARYPEGRNGQFATIGPARRAIVTTCETLWNGAPGAAPFPVLVDVDVEGGSSAPRTPPPTRCCMSR